MSALITHTKLVVPRRPTGLLERARLRDFMFDLLEFRLILVQAPAGYGKTSLLIDFAHSADMPVCWYSLDTSDRDPYLFVAHLIASIAQAFPAFGRDSEAVLNASSTRLDIEQIVRVIVNEAYKRIEDHFLIILDDYHLVTGEDSIDQFVSQFAQRASENCHLILASRTAPDLPDLDQMLVRSQAGVVTFHELAFQADEIQGFLLQNYHLTVSSSEAEGLERETEGWITGLLLSAETLQHGTTSLARLARASSVGLPGYLAQQVLDQQPAPVRDFLLRTSPMDEFDATLCADVLGPDADWSELIDTVLRRNLFVQSVDTGETWLRYHTLFRDFLQTRLAQQQPEEHDRILRRLVAAYSERGEWDKAYDVCRRLNDTALTADLIEQAGSPLVKSGRTAILATWIDDLPAGLLAARPALLSLRGIVAGVHGEAKLVLSLHDQAVAAFRAAGDLPGLARALVRRTVEHRFVGHYTESLTDAEEALAITEGAEHLRDIRAEALRAKGLSIARLGRVSEGVQWLTQSLEEYRFLGDDPSVAMLCMDLGVAYMSMGHHDQALTCYRHALDHWYQENNVVQQANVLNNLGVLEHLRGDYEGAIKLLEEALGCAKESDHVRMKALALASIGDLYRDLAALEAAQGAYSQARDIARSIDYRFLLLHLDLAEAAVSQSRGEFDYALDLLESARRQVEATGSSFEQGLWQLQVGQFALAEGRIPDAIAALTLAAHGFEESHQRVEGARSCLLLAAACHAGGDAQTALANLKRALDLTSDMQSRHCLAVVGQQARACLEFAQSTPSIGREASRLLNQIVEFEQNIPTLRRRLRREISAVPFAPPHLTFKAMGGIEVASRGRPVTRSDWEAQVARDVLFCLLAHPGGLTRPELGVIFWPDKSPAALTVQLRKTMYRLRCALDHEFVFFDKGSGLYYIDHYADYEYDVDAFEEKLKQVRSVTDVGERIAAYQAAVSLYAGPYLPDVGYAWALTTRAQLHEAFLTAALALAELYLDAKQYPTVIECCERVLVEDSFSEGAYRLTMRAYAAMGNRAAVARQFERCKQALLEEIGAPVSPQTRKLYESLMRH